MGCLSRWSDLRQCPTRSMISSAKSGMRDNRVLWRRKPSTPSAMRHSCRHRTAVLALSVSRVIPTVAAAVWREQHESDAPDMLLRAVPISCYSFEPEAVKGTVSDDNAGTHGRDSHHRTRQRLRNRTSPLDFIHQNENIGGISEGRISY